MTRNATGPGAQVVALPRLWRTAAGALRALARVTVLAMAAQVLLADQLPNTLAQMRLFAALVLAPELAAWAIVRAYSATLSVEDGTLVLQQRGRRVEVTVAAIEAVEAWSLPLPAPGVSLVLDSGERLAEGIARVDAEALAAAMIAGGARVSLRDGAAGRAIAYSAARMRNPYGRLDHPLIKFLLFSLVPTLPAFRLHQYIAYGGTFGEYYTFGLRAYLIAFAIWWASWVINLVLCAGVLRVVVEAATALAVMIAPGAAPAARRVLELLARIVFYVGIPGAFLFQLAR
ncbi:MAG TPA: hypothetical protein VEL28_15340 [Candidatus Binatia bacterium]|nr:hypothetical protein [Candidatus Binatia bacterium]